MATVSVTIPPAKAATTLAGVERIYKGDAVNLYFGGDPAGYEALTAADRAHACLKAFLTRAYQNEVRRQAEAMLPPPDDPGIT